MHPYPRYLSRQLILEQSGVQSQHPTVFHSPQPPGFRNEDQAASAILHQQMRREECYLFLEPGFSSTFGPRIRGDTNKLLMRSRLPSSRRGRVGASKKVDGCLVAAFCCMSSITSCTTALILIHVIPCIPPWSIAIHWPVSVDRQEPPVRALDSKTFDSRPCAQGS